MYTYYVTFFSGIVRYFLKSGTQHSKHSDTRRQELRLAWPVSRSTWFCVSATFRAINQRLVTHDMTSVCLRLCLCPRPCSLSCPESWTLAWAVSRVNGSRPRPLATLDWTSYWVAPLTCLMCKVHTHIEHTYTLTRALTRSACYLCFSTFSYCVLHIFATCICCEWCVLCVVLCVVCRLRASVKSCIIKFAALLPRVARPGLPACLPSRNAAREKARLNSPVELLKNETKNNFQIWILNFTLH